MTAGDFRRVVSALQVAGSAGNPRFHSSTVEKRRRPRSTD